MVTSIAIDVSAHYRPLLCWLFSCCTALSVLHSWRNCTRPFCCASSLRSSLVNTTIPDMSNGNTINSKIGCILELSSALSPVKPLFLVAMDSSSRNFRAILGFLECCCCRLHFRFSADVASVLVTLWELSRTGCSKKEETCPLLRYDIDFPRVLEESCDTTCSAILCACVKVRWCSISFR